MKSIKLIVLCIGLTIGQFSFSSNYMQLLNDGAGNSQVTADTLTKESFISPEMQWAVVSFNKPDFFVIDTKTGAVQNMPSVESLLSSINLQIQTGSVSDEQKESMQAALRAMLEATEITLSTLPIQAAYEDANFANGKILQDLNQQKTNIQLTQSRVNAINPKSYVSWMFGSSSTSSPIQSSAINLQPVHFDSNASTISIPAHLMNSIIKLNDYKQKPDATIAANLLFKQCFIAQQQHRANPIAINLNNPFNAENYIYNNFPAIYSKFNNKYPICELAQQQGRQARTPLLHIRQAIQTALAIANKKSTSNLGSFLPQYLTSYLDGVVSELMKYDNYVGELCKNPQYGATPTDIAQSAEWSTLSKVAAGAAIVGAAAGAYYFRNEIGDAGKQTYDQAVEAASWLTGKTAQLEKDKALADQLAADKAAADQKVFDDQKAIADKLAAEKAEQARIAAEEEAERIAEEEFDAANRKYLEDKAAMLKEKATSAMQTIKNNMPFVSKKVVEQEQEKQDRIEKTAPIAAEQMQYAQEKTGPIIEKIKDNMPFVSKKVIEQEQEKQDQIAETAPIAAEQMQYAQEKTAPVIKNIANKATNKEYTFGAAGLAYATDETLEPGAEEYSEDLGKYDREMAEKLAAYNLKKADENKNAIFYTTTIENDAQAAKLKTQKSITDLKKDYIEQIDAQKKVFEKTQEINTRNVQLLKKEQEQARLNAELAEAKHRRDAAYAKRGAVPVDGRWTNQTIEDIKVENIKKSIEQNKSDIATISYNKNQAVNEQAKADEEAKKLTAKTNSAKLQTIKDMAEAKELLELKNLKAIEDAKANKATQQQLRDLMKQHIEDAKKLENDYIQKTNQINKDQILNILEAEKELNALDKSTSAQFSPTQSTPKKLESEPRISTNLTKRQKQELENLAQQAKIKKDTESQAWFGNLGWTGVEALTPAEKAALEWKNKQAAKKAASAQTTKTPSESASVDTTTVTPQITPTNPEYNETEEDFYDYDVDLN